MPRSPRSYVETHRWPGIRSFSNTEVSLVSTALREMKRLRSVRNVNRVRRLISRLYSFHPQDWRISEIVRALDTTNVFSRAFTYQVLETLDRYRVEYTPADSDFSDGEL